MTPLKERLASDATPGYAYSEGLIEIDSFGSRCLLPNSGLPAVWSRSTPMTHQPSATSSGTHLLRLVPPDHRERRLEPKPVPPSAVPRLVPEALLCSSDPAAFLRFDGRISRSARLSMELVLRPHRGPELAPATIHKSHGMIMLDP